MDLVRQLHAAKRPPVVDTFTPEPEPPARPAIDPHAGRPRENLRPIDGTPRDQQPINVAGLSAGGAPAHRDPPSIDDWLRSAFLDR